MYTKKNARVTFKSNRRSNYKRNNNFSNGKGRNRGNVSQQYNKYLKLAKETLSSGDRIQSEYYYQYTDHYYRLMVELGINVEENEINSLPKTDEIKDIPESRSEDQDKISSEKELSENDSNNDLNEKNENIESIDSVPFIAEPAKKKRARTSK